MSKKRPYVSYKDKFVRDFDNAIVDPSTIRRWKKNSAEGRLSDLFIVFLILHISVSDFSLKEGLYT